MSFPSRAINVSNSDSKPKLSICPHSENISRGSVILKRRLLSHFREARVVFSKIQSDRSEENIESVSLHNEKDIDRQQRTTVGATMLNI
ncbi:hypothetical protein GQ457_07G044910 [Hibiscus cannabinus]